MRASPEQDACYAAAAAEFGGVLQRLARATEADRERRRDLLQDMHVALWRSFAAFDARCSLRTWIYRIAHNVAASHVDKQRRANRPWASLENVEQLPSTQNVVAEVEESEAIEQLHCIIRQLAAPDRQIITLYLEGLDAAEIADITGLSPGAVATRVSRLKAELARLFREAEHV